MAGREHTPFGLNARRRRLAVLALSRELTGNFPDASRQGLNPKDEYLPKFIMYRGPDLTGYLALDSAQDVVRSLEVIDGIRIDYGRDGKKVGVQIEVGKLSKLPQRL